MVNPSGQSGESAESPQAGPRPEGRSATDAPHGTTRRPNRLIHQTSPYLLQHAYNPVDWYPWGREPLERAAREDKPLFISIGYSACHWCHVMERESFEDEGIGRLMNERFVNIKVDREERPDVDAVYMEAAQLMTGFGGWPLSIFATPDGKPFFAGTYFPPGDSPDRPGFGRVLEVISEVWQHRRDEVLASGEGVRNALAGPRQAPRSGLSEDLLHQAFAFLSRRFDREHGGFGAAPKFPQAGTLLFLMHYACRSGQAKALDMVTRTLDAMAAGGLFDHVGGGFHRYTTDRQWQVPHFEKMLYDQALLATAYARAYQITGHEPYASTVRQTLDYVLRDMADPGGAFTCAEDADSEGREGAFYVWTPDQVGAVLGESDASLVSAYYGVTDRGNFEHGTSILHVDRPINEVANHLGMEPDQVKQVLERSRVRLLQARSSRPRPHRDDKIIAAWNGLAITALAVAGAALPEDRYVRAAEGAADYLLGHLIDKGRLVHQVTSIRLGGPGFLDDYALLAMGLLDLYDCTLESRWLIEAKRLTEQMVALFHDPDAGAFFFTANDAEGLIVRPKPSLDGAIPGANSGAAMALLRLGHLTLDRGLRAGAAAILESLAPTMAASPGATTGLLTALDLYLGPGQEITLVGDRGDPRTQDLINVVHSRFLPRTVTVLRPAGPSHGPIAECIPFVQGQTDVDGQPTAYVCTDHTCKPPVHTPEELANLLSSDRAL